MQKRDFEAPGTIQEGSTDFSRPVTLPPASPPCSVGGLIAWLEAGPARAIVGVLEVWYSIEHQ